MHRTLKSLAIVLGLSLSVQAAGRNFGLGFVLGDPTGFSAKLWTSANTALDFNVGWAGNFQGRDWYYNSDCGNPDFYNSHYNYCHDRGYDYRHDYGYGWRVLHLHGDYLFHNFDAIRSTERFPLYYGPGISFNYWNYSYLQFGVRGNFGIAWMPRTSPLDVFLELAPTLELFPGPDFDVSAGLGARYYF